MLTNITRNFNGFQLKYFSFLRNKSKGGCCCFKSLLTGKFEYKTEILAE